MTVSIQSAFMEIAEVLFKQAFDNAEYTNSLTGPIRHFIFEDDTLLRDARSWCADAFGCGLISMSAVTVSY